MPDVWCPLMCWMVTKCNLVVDYNPLSNSMVALHAMGELQQSLYYQ